MRTKYAITNLRYESDKFRKNYLILSESEKPFFCLLPPSIKDYAYMFPYKVPEFYGDVDTSGLRIIGNTAGSMKTETVKKTADYYGTTVEMADRNMGTFIVSEDGD